MGLLRWTRTLRTGLAPDEVLASLRGAMVAGPLFAFDRPSPSSPALRGEVIGNQFSVVRRTQVVNSFTPIARGTVAPAEGGSEVQVTLTMHPVPLFAAAAWPLVTVTVAGFWWVNGTSLEASTAWLLFGLPFMGPAFASLAWRAEAPALVEDIVLAITRRAPAT
jgi:hypothetical protein